MKKAPSFPQATDLAIEVKQLGDSAGIALTEDILAHMNVQVGDRLYVELTSEGGIHVVPSNSASSKAMDVARRGMARYQNALAKLAE